MNPWATSVLDRARSGLRFAVWAVLLLHAFMFAVFSVCWCFQFWVHLWRWSGRHIFGSDW